MKKILIILAAVSMLVGCRKHEEVFFDQPFVTITGENGVDSEMNVKKNVNNMLATLIVSLNASSTYFSDQPVTVEYQIETDGLTEDVDYKVQPTTASPLTFNPGTYSLPIRIMWLKNADWAEGKEGKMVIRLMSSSIADITVGVPGPSASKSTFTFYKK